MVSKLTVILLALNAILLCVTLVSQWRVRSAQTAMMAHRIEPCVQGGTLAPGASCSFQLEIPPPPLPSPDFGKKL